ncbi:MAG: HEAT repeat domain-containing protein [Bacteroidota bacterium]
MEKEKLESLLIDYIDGKLSEADRALVEQELAKSEEAYSMYEQLREVIQAMKKSLPIEPGISLKRDFDKFLKAELESIQKPKGKVVSFQSYAYRIAAGVAFVILSVSIGYQVNKNYRQEQELARLKSEMDATKQMMMAMLDNQQSASQRMVGATVAFKMEKMDDEIVTALAKSMNEDPNTNVRLAAMEALSKFYQEPGVQKVLIHSLSVQKDPVVQIALIQLLVQMKEKSVVNELEKIADDPVTLKAVKDEAYNGILKLS